MNTKNDGTKDGMEGAFLTNERTRPRIPPDSPDRTPLWSAFLVLGTQSSVESMLHDGSKAPVDCVSFLALEA